MSLSDRLNRTEPQTESIPYPHTGSLRIIATEAPNRLDTALVRNQVNDVLKDLVGRSLYSGNVDPDTLQSIVFKAIAVVIERNAYPLTDSERAAPGMVAAAFVALATWITLRMQLMELRERSALELDLARAIAAQAGHTLLDLQQRLLIGLVVQAPARPGHLGHLDLTDRGELAPQQSQRR